MMSSKILWQFKRGDKIVQLFLLPYISINSSNDVRTGGLAVQIKNNLYDIIGI